MRHLELARRAGVLAAGAVAGVLVAAGPAAADVAVSPASAAQGSGANLTFRVTNTGSSPITRVKLVLPPDTPVAEVYPLSADDWAPQITQQKLAHPLTTIHGGTPVSETAKDITWIAMPGRDIAPGRYADLSIALGPLPTVSRMSFEIRATYASGAGPAMPPAVLALTPAAPGQAPAHGGHAATATTGSDDAAFAAAVAQADRGPKWWSIAGWIAAALLATGMAVAYLRSRRRRAPNARPESAAIGDDAPGPNDPSAVDQEHRPRHQSAADQERMPNDPRANDKERMPNDPRANDEEPVAAGTRVRGSWRYRETPE